MRVPDDTLSVLKNITAECKRILPSLHIYDKLLLMGAVIDAENLIDEIKSETKS